MRLCRFGDGRLGLVEGESVRDVTAALEVLPRYSYPLPGHDVFIGNLDAVAARARTLAKDAPVLPLSGLTLLSPVANPGKIIAAPVNYQKHLNEVRENPQLHGNNPGHTFTIQSAGLFLKATSSLVEELTNFTYQRLRADIETGRSLMSSSSDLGQALNLQGQFVADAMRDYLEETTRIVQLATQTTREVWTPLQEFSARLARGEVARPS